MNTKHRQEMIDIIIKADVGVHAIVDALLAAGYGYHKSDLEEKYKQGFFDGKTYPV